MKNDKFKLIFNHLRNCSSQSEKSGKPMREQKYSHWRKQRISKEREKEWIRTKMKSFHSGYSDQEVRIKDYPFLSSQLWIRRSAIFADPTDPKHWLLRNGFNSLTEP